MGPGFESPWEHRHKPKHKTTTGKRRTWATTRHSGAKPLNQLALTRLFSYTRTSGDEGAFDGHVFSPNLRDVPVLMRLTNDDHISLSITEWYDEMSCFDKHTSTAHSTPVESGELLWEFDGDTWERGDYIPDGAERFTGEITVANALSDWEDLVNSVAAREDSQEYAWFFPVGLNAAFKLSGMMMFASNQN